MRGLLSRIMGIDDSRIRVIMPDVGGAFGQKMWPRPEELAVAFATRRLGRPVKWIEDRRENLLCGEHAREDHATVSVAVNEHGTILGAKADFLESAGSFPVAASSALLFSAPLFPGPYRIPAYAGSGRTVYTNTAGRTAYRGPWQYESLAREVLLDLAVEEGKLKRESLSVRDGRVTGPGGKPSFAFGKLTRGKKLVKLIDERAPTTPPAKWTVAGTSVPKVDGRAFVTGRHAYTSDISRDGMVYGRVVRPPAFRLEQQSSCARPAGQRLASP